jgi:hypothetical protein
VRAFSNCFGCYAERGHTCGHGIYLEAAMVPPWWFLVALCVDGAMCFAVFGVAQAC